MALWGSRSTDLCHQTWMLGLPGTHASQHRPTATKAKTHPIWSEYQWTRPSEMCPRPVDPVLQVKKTFLSACCVKSVFLHCTWVAQMYFSESRRARILISRKIFLWPFIFLPRSFREWVRGTCWISIRLCHMSGGYRGERYCLREILKGYDKACN